MDRTADLRTLFVQALCCSTKKIEASYSQLCSQPETMSVTVMVPPNDRVSIEAYIIESESYRTCYPQVVPWPLPVSQSSVGTDAMVSATSFEELLSRLPSILQQYNMPTAAQVIQTWQWQFDEPKQKVMTVLVTADWDPIAWVGAARAIYNLLRSKCITDTLVELINPERVNYKKIVSTCVSEPDRRYFETIQQSICQIVMHHLKAAFLCMGLFLYAQGSFVSQVPCLFIFVKPGFIFDWETVSTRIIQVLGNRFKLQFRPGRHSAFAAGRGPPMPHGLLAPGEFESEVRTGTSISTTYNPHSGGTSGIFIDLDVSQTSPATPFGLSAGTSKCLLTCHHVIQPPPGSPDYQEALDYGYPLLSKPLTSPQVVSPSILKLQMAIRALQTLIARDEADLQDLQQQPSSPACRRNVALLRSETKTSQKRLQFCQQLQLREPIGRVLFSTMHVANTSQCQPIDPGPCSQHDHSLMDFALIQLRKHNSHSNKALLLRENGPSLYDVERTAQPTHGMRVFKCGSETGITTGIIHGQYFLLHDAGLGFYRAWGILGDGGTKFAAPGDSGSGITTESKMLVGQLHSGLLDRASQPLVFMTSIQTIFEGIEATIPSSSVTLSACTPSLLGSSLGKAQNFLLSLRRGLPWTEQDDSIC
ncbi:MAG: hypothetical protein LQ338_007545 [Usnochroma carphineum]|nr:MAG: hypothetical protein LQ338_007545 [Usnochroma carphineum]